MFVEDPNAKIKTCKDSNIMCGLEPPKGRRIKQFR